MRFVPLSQGFGAEVVDFDPADDTDGNAIAAIGAAWRRHHLLIFRCADTIRAERQVEIAGWLGPVLRETGDVTLLDNADPAGRLPLPFHSDITFCEFPLEGIGLVPVALPDSETTTSFVSTATAWQRLAPALQRAIAGRLARHSYESAMIDLGIPRFTHWHPACLHHPDSGEPLLFVTEHHVDRIAGHSPERSAELLAECFAVLYAPECIYEHVWRQGDFVIWDNRAIQHARRAEASPAAGRRVMRRVQLGRVGFLAQVAALRDAARTAELRA